MAYEEYLGQVTALAQSEVPSAEPVIQVENSWPNLLGVEIPDPPANGGVYLTLSAPVVVAALFGGQSPTNQESIANALAASGKPEELLGKFIADTAAICHEALE